MATGWSQKDSLALVLDLGRQGATIVERKNGWTVRFPDGTSTMSVHSTISDIRAPMNMRAEVLRAGFRWPFDGEGFKKGGRVKTYNTIADSIDQSTMEQISDRLVIEEELPLGKDEPPLYARYITHPKGNGRPDDRSIAIVRGGAAHLLDERGLVDATAVKDYLFRLQHQAISLDQVRRVLYWLGYRYDPATVERKTRGWAGLWRLDPTLDRTAEEMLPITHFDQPEQDPEPPAGPDLPLPAELAEAEALTVSGPAEAGPSKADMDAAEEMIAELQGLLDAERQAHRETGEQRDQLQRDLEAQRVENTGLQTQVTALLAQVDRREAQHDDDVERTQRLQDALAYERSKPAFSADGWRNVAALPDAAAIEGLGLEARVQVRWKEQG